MIIPNKTNQMMNFPLYPSPESLCSVNISKSLSISEVYSKDDFTFEDYIGILNKPSKLRTNTDCLALANFISKTALVQKLKDEKLSDDNLNNMLYALAANLELVSLDKNNILFRIDDIGDNFYIILKGRVYILKPVEFKLKIKTKDYIRQLRNLKNSGEKYLLSKTIKLNYYNYPIEGIDELDKAFDIFFKLRFLKLIKQDTKDVNQLETFFIENDHSFEEYSIDRSLLEDSLFEIDRTIRDIRWEEYLLSKIEITSDEYKEIERYKNFYTNELREYTVYQYRVFMSLFSGQYFGDYALDSYNRKRTATIMTDTESYIVSIRSSIYKEFIQDEKQKIKLKNITFLNNNFFFNNIRFTNFDKIYFPLFAPYELARGNVVYSENELSDKVVFIKEGQIELTAYLNVDEINNYLQLMIDKLKNENINLYKKVVNTIDFNIERNKGNEYYEKFKIKRKLNLVLLGPKEIFGLEEIILGINRFIKTTVVTQKANIYIIESNFIKKILNNEKSCQNDYNMIVDLKIISLIKRLNHFRNSFIKEIQKSSIKKLNDSSNIEYSGIETNNTYKSPIIKNYMNFDSLYNYSNINSPNITESPMYIISPISITKKKKIKNFIFEKNILIDDRKKKVSQIFKNDARIKIGNDNDNVSKLIKKLKESHTLYENNKKYVFSYKDFLDKKDLRENVTLMNKIKNKFESNLYIKKSSHKSNSQDIMVNKKKSSSLFSLIISNTHNK